MANPFNDFKKTVSEVADFLFLDKNIKQKLVKPEKIIKKTIKFKMDNGRTREVLAYRVQHNSALGPYKGGIRYLDQVDLNEVKALAGWMMIKCSLLNLPYGGGKGGIKIDPKKLTTSELERMTRAFTDAFYKNFGPKLDVPAPDVNTDEQIMSWIYDEYSKLVGKDTPAVVTGKPVKLGGSIGRDKATAQGGAYILKSLTQKLKLKPKNLTVAIQGFGNAGAHLALLLDKIGFKIIAVSDSSGAILKRIQGYKDTIDQINSKLEIQNLTKYKEKTGSVLNFKNWKNITNEQLLELPVDVLVPAALENVVTAKNAAKIKAKIVLEIANGPVSKEAERMLLKNNILIVPDILANAGGVTVSYFEWYQNLYHQKWPGRLVDQKLKAMMVKAFENVWNFSQKRDVNLRFAAYILAITRIVRALNRKNKTKVLIG